MVSGWWQCQKTFMHAFFGFAPESAFFMLVLGDLPVFLWWAIGILAPHWGLITISMLYQEQLIESCTKRWRGGCLGQLGGMVSAYVAARPPLAGSWFWSRLAGLPKFIQKRRIGRMVCDWRLWLRLLNSLSNRQNKGFQNCLCCSKKGRRMNVPKWSSCNPFLPMKTLNRVASDWRA